jgi:hypothetical protein
MITALSINILTSLLIVGIALICFAGHCLYSYVARRWHQEIAIPLQMLIEACQPLQEQNSEYFAVPTVLMEDEPLHTDEHPQCDDPTCPCKEFTTMSR